MTPFGEKIRALRKLKNVSQKDMATALNVSPAYLSALERGHRGKPQWPMIQRIITYFNIIWDEAEDLQRLALVSDPKVPLNTRFLSANATKLANLLSFNIGCLSEKEITALINQVEKLIRQTK